MKQVPISLMKGMKGLPIYQHFKYKVQIEENRTVSGTITLPFSCFEGHETPVGL